MNYLNVIYDSDKRDSLLIDQGIVGIGMLLHFLRKRVELDRVMDECLDQLKDLFDITLLQSE